MGDETEVLLVESSRLRIQSPRARNAIVCARSPKKSHLYNFDFKYFIGDVLTWWHLNSKDHVSDLFLAGASEFQVVSSFDANAIA